MSDYLYKKFYKKYRILVPIDQETFDFPRGPDGKIETDDYYISCRRNGREIAHISHYGRNILDVLVFTPNTGHKILKLCEQEGISVSNIKEGDGEVSFRFNVKDMDFIAENLGAMTQGKNIRPFSPRNLPKTKYIIPEEDLSRYKDIVSVVPIGERLVITRITAAFLNEKVDKNHLKRDMKEQKMARQKKEYIHKIGLWEEYLEYLKEGLEEYAC